MGAKGWGAFSGRPRPFGRAWSTSYFVTRLVVTESTYSWWAAYVGAATEVHAPGVGTVPVPADEHRYVFHDIASRRYWGRWDAAAREIRYPDARRRGDDDDDAIPMGFGVGHPSFKAAFPESASWDK